MRWSRWNWRSRKRKRNWRNILTEIMMIFRNGSPNELEGARAAAVNLTNQCLRTRRAFRTLVLLWKIRIVRLRWECAREESPIVFFFHRPRWGIVIFRMLNISRPQITKKNTLIAISNLGKALAIMSKTWCSRIILFLEGWNRLWAAVPKSSNQN